MCPPVCPLVRFPVLPIRGPGRVLIGGLFVLSLAGVPAGADEKPASGAGFATGFGPGVDWSLTGRVSLSSEVDTNRDLDPGENDDLLSTNRLDAGLSLGARTKRGLYTADLGLAGRVYLGPDQPGADTWPVDPRFAASALYTGKRYEFSSSFSFDVQPTSETQFDDTGILSDDDLQLTVNFSAALALEVSRRDRLTLSASARAIEFVEDAPGLEANRNFTAGLGWNRTLDARTSAGLELTFGYFTAEDVVATRSQTLGVSASISQQRTRRHNIGLSLGPSFVRTEERGRGTDFDVGFNGSASFGYSLRDLTLGLSLSQGIEPSSVGELQSFSRGGASLNWRVNPEESLSLSVDFTHRTGLDGSEPYNSALARASYNIALTREDNLSFGYQFRAVNDDIDGFASGHQVFLTLNHNFTLLP